MVWTFLEKRNNFISAVEPNCSNASRIKVTSILTIDLNIVTLSLIIVNTPVYIYGSIMFYFFSFCLYFVIKYKFIH